jgi:hypothetical protein
MGDNWVIYILLYPSSARCSRLWSVEDSAGVVRVLRRRRAGYRRAWQTSRVERVQIQRRKCHGDRSGFSRIWLESLLLNVEHPSNGLQTHLSESSPNIALANLLIRMPDSNACTLSIVIPTSAYWYYSTGESGRSNNSNTHLPLSRSPVRTQHLRPPTLIT